MPGAASAADNVVTATADLPDGTPGTGVPGYSAQADAPVALVNDRQMVSYMSNDKLDELVDALKAQAK